MKRRRKEEEGGRKEEFDAFVYNEESPNDDKYLINIQQTLSTW
jgi:hypothetical protein